MNYPTLTLDILELFASARYLGRPHRKGAIGRIIGWGHYYNTLARFWCSQHRTQRAAKDRARRRARLESRPYVEAICHECGTVNHVQVGRSHPVGGWCCDAMRSPITLGVRAVRARRAAR